MQIIFVINDGRPLKTNATIKYLVRHETRNHISWFVQLLRCVEVTKPELRMEELYNLQCPIISRAPQVNQGLILHLDLNHPIYDASQLGFRPHI